MIRSRPWRINHKASICLQSLYFFAMIFIIGWPSCRSPGPPGLSVRWSLYALLVANLCVFGLHMMVSCCWFAKLEADEQALFEAQLEHFAANPAVAAEIFRDRLAIDLDAHSYVVSYKPPEQLPEGALKVRSTQCMICFSDYQEGDRVRLLRCWHDGHSQCLDPWLIGRRPACPLCAKDVDDPSLPPLIPQQQQQQQQQPQQDVADAHDKVD